MCVNACNEAPFLSNHTTTDSGRKLQVPKEESIAEIRDRYMDINSHAASYNWKALISSPGSDQVRGLNTRVAITRDVQAYNASGLGRV